MSLINWKLPVADKEVFWDTLQTHEGWKLQHNKVVGQYRVVSPGKYREAWGFNCEEIANDFKRLSGYSEKKAAAPVRESQQEQPQVNATEMRAQLYKQLEQAGELFDKGFLTEKEFETEKAAILAQLSKLQ